MLRERDMNILEFLLRYRYLDTEQIKRNFFATTSKENMYKVLLRLEKLGLIEKRSFPKTTNLKLGYLVHLREKGAKALAYEWKRELDEMGYKRIKNPITSINRYYHRKKMTDFWIRLDEELEKFPQIELKYLATDTEYTQRKGKRVPKSRLETKDGKVSIVPDIVFTLRNPKKKAEMVFCVEIDTGKETIGGRFLRVKPNSLYDKYERYEAILQDEGWKDTIYTNAKAFRVLTVTEKIGHIKEMQKQSKQFIKWKDYFLNSTYEIIESEEHGIFGSKSWLSLSPNSEAKGLFL